MLTINLKGKITSKRAAHVPVFRNWKLVMERREFGTKVDKIDAEYPLVVAGKGILSRADIPADGLKVVLSSEPKIMLLIKRLAGGEDPDALTVTVLYEGIRVPGMSYSTSFPARSEFKVLRYSGEVYKGVVVELEATLFLRV